jgi:hypothetical protein
MAPAPRELARFLAPYPPEVRRTMRDGRAILKARFPLATEMIYDATSAVGVGFAYTGDLKGLFVNLAAFSGHVTLVFAWGVKLKDPQGLLRGEGKQVRHLRLAGPADLVRPDVVALLGQAEANAPRPATPRAPGLVVKVYAGPKRRPRPAPRAP